MNKERVIYVGMFVVGGFLLYKGMKRVLIDVVMNSQKGGKRFNYVKKKGMVLSESQKMLI